jgi:hypothetical protein
MFVQGVFSSIQQLALVLVFTVAFPTTSFASDAVTTPESPQLGNIRTQVQKYGAEKKRVKITLRTGRELKGHISRSDDTGFDLTERSGNVSKLSYEDVAGVHSVGLGTGAKIAIGVGCAVAITAAVIAIGLKRAGY